MGGGSRACSARLSGKYRSVLASGLSCSLFSVGLEGPEAGRTVACAFGISTFSFITAQSPRS